MANIKTIVLSGAEEAVELYGGNCDIRNDGTDTVYASAEAGITAGADGVLSIPAGGAAKLLDCEGTVHLLGTGSVMLCGNDYSELVFKSAATSSAGGGGITETLPTVLASCKAVHGDAKATISWGYSNTDYVAGIRICYKTDSYPENSEDGTYVDIEGTETLSTDITELTNGAEYYFRLFLYNNNMDFQTSVTNATCSAMPSPDIVIWSKHMNQSGNITTTNEGKTMTIAGSAGAGAKSNTLSISGTLSGTCKWTFEGTAGSGALEIYNADTNVKYKEYPVSATNAGDTKSASPNISLPAGNYYFVIWGGCTNGNYSATFNIAMLPLA